MPIKPVKMVVGHVVLVECLSSGGLRMRYLALSYSEEAGSHKGIMGVQRGQGAPCGVCGHTEEQSGAKGSGL
jgi:hypothetical protein